MARQPRPKSRHKSLIAKEVSPQSIVFDRDGRVPRPYDATKPLIVTSDKHPELLLGRARLEEHLALHPHRTIGVVQVSGLATPDYLSFRRLDSGEPPLPSDLMHAVAAARRAKLPLAQIAEILPGVTSVSDASVFANLALSPPYVIERFDSGSLTLAHVRRFIALPAQEQVFWAEMVVSKGLRVSGLVDAMANKRVSAGKTADILHQQGLLSDALGTKTDIAWDERNSKGVLTIPWFNIEELQGVMTAIGNSPPAETALPRRERNIQVEFDSLAEFQAFVGHLLTKYPE